jgi:hypothetical protein
MKGILAHQSINKNQCPGAASINASQKASEPGKQSSSDALTGRETIKPPASKTRITT